MPLLDIKLWLPVLSLLVVAMPLMTSVQPRAARFGYHPALAAPHAASTQLAAASTVLRRWLLLLTPWPEFAHADLGWYRHGLREVAQHETVIRAVGDERVPAVLLAAAIANQGSSAQRPFGIEAIEHLQHWLGVSFDWPLDRWQWAATRWRWYVEEPSVGVAQLVPKEAQALLGFGRPDPFDAHTSIRLMYEKLEGVAMGAEALALDPTHRFMLMAIGNNSGDGAVDQFLARGADMRSYLAASAEARIQIAKMMTYVEYFADAGWEVPAGVNRRLVWRMLEQAEPRSAGDGGTLRDRPAP